MLAPYLDISLDLQEDDDVARHVEQWLLDKYIHTQSKSTVTAYRDILLSLRAYLRERGLDLDSQAAAISSAVQLWASLRLPAASGRAVSLLLPIISGSQRSLAFISGQSKNVYTLIAIRLISLRGPQCRSICTRGRSIRSRSARSSRALIARRHAGCETMCFCRWR